jgi:ketosteroid isomerase-like protein
MSTEIDVRKTSDKFYAALNRTLNGDARSMVDVWSHNSDVSTMHPIGGSQVGWDEVRASWENLAGICSNGQVSLSDQRICVGGDFSYEVGIEHVDVLVTRNKVQTDFRVTNIYRREGGEWRMVHHHTDLNLKMLEILSKLETSQQNVSGV